MDNEIKDYSNVTDYSFLPEGKKNAILPTELAAMMNFSSVRALQQDIAKSRESGQIILSSTTPPGGYYRSTDPIELEEFCRTLTCRAKATFRALRSAKQALAQSKGEIPGQMDFSDIWEV